MEYIIVTILAVILILQIISMFKSSNESNITERLGKLETNLVKELGEFKSDLKDNLNKNFVESNSIKILQM